MLEILSVCLADDILLDCLLAFSLAFFLFFFLSVLHSLQDLSSHQDLNPGHGSDSTES